MIRSLREVDTLMSTIRKVDKDISRRRLEIKRNIVPNAGLARKQVEALVRENNRRKAYLRVNSGHIEALRASGARFTPLRTSFITPDGPKHKGNKRDSKRRRRALDNFRKTVVPTPKPITTKQGKKVQGQRISITAPAPVKETVAKPRQFMQQAADSIREQNAILGKRREQAIRKQMDARRDAELVKQGRSQLVAQRRAREAAESKAKAEAEAKRRRAKISSNAKQAAVAAESRARSAASRASQSKISRQVVSRGRSMFNTRGRSSFRRTGFLPQMVMLTALNDKKRTQTVNNATRSPSAAPKGPIKDQITEDIRQHKPVIRQYSEGYRETMMELQKLNKMAKKELEAALKGRGAFADQAQLLGPEKTKLWVSKGYSLLKQVNEVVSNEAMRWEKGSLNAGVAVSTDTRSQSTRKMTKNEFNMHLSKKLNPIIMKAMNEFEEEVRRAQMNSSSLPPSALQPTKPGVSPAQANHIKNVTELSNYKAFYEEQAAQWWHGLRKEPFWNTLRSNGPIMAKINGYYTSADAMKKKITNLYSAKIGGDRPLDKAKADIEAEYMMVIPLAVSEVQKVEPAYSFQQKRLPPDRKRELSPYSAPLGSMNGGMKNINVPVQYQKGLAGHDKLRGHGRPVLSEQQGTKGLAGLFPALRSSMQGALRQ